jgi:hypothetical protein
MSFLITVLLLAVVSGCVVLLERLEAKLEDSSKGQTR